MPAPTNPGPDRRRLLVLAAAFIVAVLLAAPPIEWLPPAREARPLLSALLGAQAAIAALTLAVTLFVLQVVGARQDADDRMSREYVRRSWVRPIFWGSVGAVGVTGAALLAEEFIGAGAPVLAATPGLRNLALLAACAFTANLALAVALFERAIRLAQPDEWRRLRREVNERDVRDAVRAFLRRRQRATTTAGADEPDWGLMFPSPDERSAGEAVRSLLDDARSAMDERRQGDFTRALDSIKELIEYAMNEIEPQVPHWEDPGAQPEWPPLAELDRNLYTFREDVIQRGNREHGFALLDLDYWLLRTGVQRRCGELFTVALEGYRRNYEIASRVGSNELREMFRDRAWSVMPGALVSVSAEDGFPYMRHAVQLQERLLSDAMHSQDSADFGLLRDAFSDLLRHLRFSWGATRWPRPASADLYEELRRAYRIRLMGLGGRAMLLTETGRIPAPAPYVEPARDAYDHLDQLAGDMPRILTGDERRQSLWSDWEMEGARSLEARRMRPEQYPLTFFSVRLLELARDPMPVLDLDGRAQQVLDWFETNGEALERHVHLESGTSIEERRELALGALRAAVQQDEVAAEEEMIDRELSEERIAAFTADVYEAAFSNNAVERLFAHAGAFEYLAGAADGGLEEPDESQYVPKGFLAEEPEDARAYYPPLEGDDWGGSHADDVIAMLREALGEAPPIEAPLDSEQDLLSAIDAALGSLGADGDVIVLLTGDWDRVTFDLAMDPPGGYKSRLGRQPVHTLGPGVEARYRGHPIIWDRADGERRLYVVEPGTWGCFVRQQAEGDTDLLVEVEPIPEERARELLSENPNHLPDIDDHDVKLRKMQTYVRVGVAARTGFRVLDPERARKVVPPSSE